MDPPEVAEGALDLEALLATQSWAGPQARRQVALAELRREGELPELVAAWEA